MLMNQTLESILKSYFGSENPTGISSINGGLTNFNYRITMPHNSEYFLKVFRGTPVDRVIGITRLIEIITAFHFPTPELLPCKNGEKYWSDGNQSAVITNYIQGTYPEKNTDNLFKIGTYLGILHNLPTSRDLLRGYSLQYDNQIQLLNLSGITLPKEMKSFLLETDKIIQNLPTSGFPESIIHGDVFLDNLIITNSGEIFFVDFEGGCIDRSIFDLARTIIGCAVNNYHIETSLVSAIISGYIVSRQLSSIEYDFLYESIVYAGTISTLWRYIEFNVKRPGEFKTELYQELMKPTLNFIKTGRNAFVNEMAAWR